MPSKDDLPATCDLENLPNRRDTFRLLVGIAALATGLGVPLSALGGTAAARITIKFQQSKEDGGRLISSMALPDNVVEYLASSAGARMQWKLYEQTAGELGTIQVPAQVFSKMKDVTRAD